MALSRSAEILRQLLEPRRLTIDLGPVFDSRLGLELRRDEARSLILRTLGADASAWSQAGPRVSVQTDADLDMRLDDLAEGLARIAERLVTGRLVVERLGITNQERLRWTKDGRLRQAGSASIHRGHRLAIPTYDPDRLAAITPKTVLEWRSQDQEAQAAKATD